MKRARDEPPLDHLEAGLAQEQCKCVGREVVEVGANEPGPLLTPHPRVQARHVDRRQHDDSFVVDDVA
jgi:hypothetical protein